MNCIIKVQKALGDYDVFATSTYQLDKFKHAPKVLGLGFGKESSRTMGFALLLHASKATVWVSR